MRDPRPKKAQGQAGKPRRGRGQRQKQVGINLTFPDGTFWKTVKLDAATAEQMQGFCDQQGVAVGDYLFGLMGRAWRQVHGGGAK